MRRALGGFTEAKNRRLQRNEDHSLAPLLVRAGATRSLGSIIVLLALLMLGVGTYEVIEALQHPLEAQSAMLIAAAVIIALAIILVFYVLEPLAAPRMVHRREAAMHARQYALRKELHLAGQPTATQSELPFGSTLPDGGRTGD